MSYAQRKELSGNRTLSIILVVVLQFALGYAIITGLAYNVIKKAAEDLKTFDVEEQPPPPEEPPPPPKDMPDTPPPPTMPPSIVQTIAPPPPISCRSLRLRRSSHRSRRRRRRRRRRRARFPPPSAKGNLIGLFSDEDYPASASAAGAAGTAQAQLTIGARWAGYELQPHAFDWQRLARFSDLQYSSSPREVHARARQ